MTIKCTYDYFPDETNYILFVPEVADGSASDCHIFIYNWRGELVATRSHVYPFETKVSDEPGVYKFMLQSGTYFSLCYINGDKVEFDGVETLERAAIVGVKAEEINGTWFSSRAEHAYAQPSDMGYYRDTPIYRP